MARSRRKHAVLHGFLSYTTGLGGFSVKSFGERLVQRVQRHMNSERIIYNISNNISDAILTILLRRTNIGVHTVFISGNLLHGGRTRRIQTGFTHVGIRVRAISTSRHFLTTLSKRDSPRGGHHVVKNLFVSIF